jgi:hypothetical protein
VFGGAIVDQAADGSECTTGRLVPLEQTESDLAEIAAIRATAPETCLDWLIGTQAEHGKRALPP